MLSSFIDRNAKWIFILPAVIYIVLLVAFPFFTTLYVSLTDWSMISTQKASFVGVGNFMSLLEDKVFYKSLGVTFYYTALAVVFEVVLGLIIALILNKEFIGKKLVKMFFLLPYAATPVAVSLAWTLFYEPSIGLANYILNLLGLPASEWIASEKTVVPSLVLIDIWKWTPMLILIFSAGLASLPEEPFESAEVDGATPFQVFKNITLPLLSPILWAGAVLRTIDCLKTFDIIYATTGGGPQNASKTINIYGYELGFRFYRFGSGSAALMILFVIIIIVAITMMRISRRSD